jgi:hypothetical protein
MAVTDDTIPGQTAGSQRKSQVTKEHGTIGETKKAHEEIWGKIHDSEGKAVSENRNKTA